jgi:predicted secreted hydrolase
MPSDPLYSKKSGRLYSRSYREEQRRRRAARRYLFVGLAVLVVAAAWAFFAWMPDAVAVRPALATAPVADGVSTERTAALPPLRLPADEAPHGSGMEWWYYNGILDAPEGQRYAFHVAVFVATGLVKHTAMHVALTDLQTGKRTTSQTRTGGVPAQNVANGFDFSQGRWRVAASGPVHTLQAASDEMSLKLDVREAGPVVAHRAADSKTPGLLDFGKAGISYYYSRPRMAAKGEIVVAGKTVPVSGEVWFDHQWGEFDASTLGWNWFALHLANGTDVMVYQLFDAEGRKVMTAGTVTDKTGSSPLKAQDIDIAPGASWTSPATKIPYVVEWRLRLPSGVYDVQPFFPDGEFDSRETTANVYWEGPVRVSGSAAGQGFLEMSGYDRLHATQANRR